MSPINRAAQCFVFLWVALLLSGCTAGPNTADALPTPALEPSPPTPTSEPAPYLPASIPPRPAANGWIAFSLNDEDFRADIADIYLTSLDGTPRRIIGFDGDGLVQSCPVFSPDGTLLAYGERAESTGGRNNPTEAAVVIVALDSSGVPSPRLRIPAGDMFNEPCPKWSPDGRAVAFLAGDLPALWVAPLVGPPTDYGDLPCNPGVGCPVAFDWTPDGAALVFAHWEALRLVPLDGTEPSILARAASNGDLKEFFESMSASPLALTLALGGGWMRVTGSTGSQESAFVRVVNMDHGQVIFEQTSRVGGFHTPVWSPDGTRIAWSFGDELFVHAIDDAPAVGRQGPWVIEGVGAPVGLASGVVWSPDGTRLLFVGYAADPYAYAIVSIAADGTDPQVLSPWSMELYNAGREDLSWQAVDR